MHRAVRAVCLTMAVSCASLLGQLPFSVGALAQQAELLQKYDHWAAYVSAGQPKVCFIVSQPTSKAPSGVRRGPVFFYVSRYPSENIPNEVNIKMGYPFAPGGKVTVTVDDKKFSLFTKDEAAFVETRAMETQLVEAMKAGSRMTVQGTSSRGTQTTDQYSLSGVTAATGRLEKDCN